MLLGRLELGRPEQSLLVTGLRGVGKTVLLDAFESIGIERGWFASSTEVTSDTRLAKVIATMTREALLDLRRIERVRESTRRALSILKAFTITTGVGIKTISASSWTQRKASRTAATSGATSATCS